MKTDKDSLKENRGVWFVREYLASGIVSFSEKDLSRNGDKHEIRGCTLNEDFQKDRAKMERFREDLPDLMLLLCTVEEDPRLRIPRTALSGSLQPYFGGEDVSGLLLMNLFLKGLLRLEKRNGSGTVLYAERLLLTGMKDAKDILTALADDILTFRDGGIAQVEIRPFRRSRTVECSDGLQVTYYLDDAFEARFGTDGTNLPDTGKRLENVRKNRNNTLKQLSEMLKQMEQRSKESLKP